VVTERIVVFRDDPPHGRPHARMFEVGLGWCEGVVALPHARRRLHLHDAQRVSLLARRVAPAVCLGLEDGARYRVDGAFDPGAIGTSHRGLLRLGLDGVVVELAA
jgi:hypothetical protein